MSLLGVKLKYVIREQPSDCVSSPHSEHYVTMWKPSTLWAVTFSSQWAPCNHVITKHSMSCDLPTIHIFQWRLFLLQDIGFKLLFYWLFCFMFHCFIYFTWLLFNFFFWFWFYFWSWCFGLFTPCIISINNYLIFLYLNYIKTIKNWW